MGEDEKREPPPYRLHHSQNISSPLFFLLTSSFSHKKKLPEPSSYAENIEKRWGGEDAGNPVFSPV